jgi:signal transduction histidine kinase
MSLSPQPLEMALGSTYPDILLVAGFPAPPKERSVHRPMPHVSAAHGASTEADVTKTLLHHGSLLAFVVAMALALGLGLDFLRRYRDALQTVSASLAEVNRGRFETRIPAQGKIWGLDELTTKTNAVLDQLQNLTLSLNHASAEIAHTLKRPLIGLRHRLEHARDEPLDDAQVAELIDASIGEIDSMVGMFEAILDIAQIEGGDFRSRFTDVDLKSVLLKLVDVYEAVIQDSGHRLVVKLDSPSEALVNGDFSLLFQMFNNLIENAILYCPVGTTISISLAASGDELVVTIADNGPGLSAQDRKNVFRPFFRPESTQQTPGHGLGIPFVAAIVRLHRARILLEDNAPGLKASVYFTRVRAKPDAKPKKMTASAAPLGAKRPSLRMGPRPH